MCTDVTFSQKNSNFLTDFIFVWQEDVELMWEEVQESFVSLSPFVLELLRKPGREGADFASPACHGLTSFESTLG